MWVNLTTCETWDKSLTHRPVPIILTSYHRPKTFQRCLESLVKATRHPIYIIDNSEGGLDKELAKASTHSNVLVIQNPKNIGKPSSIREHWGMIPQGQWFITMDPDVIIPPNGIQNLINSANKLCENGYQVGVMTPALTQHNRTWEHQMQTRNLVMHNWTEMRKIENGIFCNSTLAGCLMLVNNLFFNEIGGFPGTRLYNDDDGWLCNQSIKSGLMNVLNSRVICEHDLSEESPEYRSWKDRNATQQVDLSGHWDR